VALKPRHVARLAQILRCAKTLAQDDNQTGPLPIKAMVNIRRNGYQR